VYSVSVTLPGISSLGNLKQNRPTCSNPWLCLY